MNKPILNEDAKEHVINSLAQIAALPREKRDFLVGHGPRFFPVLKYPYFSFTWEENNSDIFGRLHFGDAQKRCEELQLANPDYKYDVMMLD